MYPAAALHDSALSSGCGLSHEQGCPSLLLEESGAATSLWASASSSLPPYPAPASLGALPATATPRLEEPDPEDLKREVLAVDPGDPDLPASWAEYRRIASLVRILLDHPDFLYVSGQHRPGAAVGRELHLDWTRTLGEDHPDTLAVANRLAGFLIGLRKHAEARDLFADNLPGANGRWATTTPIPCTPRKFSSPSNASRAGGGGTCP